MKVLTIDDSSSIRRLIRRFLEPLGFDVIEASNGYEGVEKARLETPDLIVLDMNMPSLDGRETFKQIRAEPKIKEIPVVMLTAEAGEELVVSLIRAGIAYYIVKPFEPAFLVEKICQILGVDCQLGQRPVFKAPVEIAKKTHTVAVVDDNESILLAAKKFLDGVAKVIAASCPFKAIQLATEHVPDVVLLDLTIPDIQVSEVLGMMLTDERFVGCRFVAMATQTMQSEIQSARQQGFHDILLKPFDRASLLDVVLDSTPGSTWERAITRPQVDQLDLDGVN